MPKQPSSEPAYVAPLAPAKLQPEAFKARFVLVNGATLLMVFLCLAPLLWLYPYMQQYASLRQRAQWLAVVGVLHVLWNGWTMRWALLKTSPEPSDILHDFTFKEQVLFFSVQFPLAFACKWLAVDHNPFGVMAWFWLPTSIFSVVLTSRYRSAVLITLASIIIATTQEYFRSGPHSATILFMVHLSGAIYSAGSAVASKYAMQQRWKLGRMTLQLQEANLQIAQQAEAATALAVAQERNQLAREIHDSVGHSLTVVGAQLDAAEAMLARAPECALEALRKARRANQEGLLEIRRSVKAMRASPLDHGSLPEAVAALVDAMKQPHLNVILKQTGVPQALPRLVELTLYRCAQEGLTNACRHANASEVCVHLNFENVTHATVSVSDNGTTFSQAAGEGLGLRGLRERAILLNGAFTIGHSPSGGCLIQMALPS